MPQSLSSVLIHLVFSTKTRRPFITNQIEPELHAYLATVFRACDSPVLKIGGVADHVHILFALARTRTIAEVVEEAKKRTSKWIKTKGPEFIDFKWQAGYGVFSVSQAQKDVVIEYIADQATHHERYDFEYEYRRLLKRHGVEYDER